MSDSSITNPHTRTINIVIAALGGQGGGVLLNWITQVAKNAGWPTQATSVPGVAQRTGATIYYLELYPNPNGDLPGHPVMSLFPMQNNVDLVIASEIVEAGRMLQRGFATPERTTLITSTHRVYAIGERAAVRDEVIDAEALRTIASEQTQQLIMFDMEAIAAKHSTVISAALLGALAGSAALPFSRSAFEAVISSSDIQVNSNLAAFDAAFARAANPDRVQHYEPPTVDPFELPTNKNPATNGVMNAIRELPATLHEVAYLGARKLANYQDFDYALDYVARLQTCAARDSTEYEFETTKTFAQQLALWMSFDDIIRVAHLKIKKSRLAQLHQEVQAKPDEVVEVRDFFKPRVEEIVGLFPYRIGKKLESSALARKVIGWFTGGKQLATNHLLMFLCLRGLAALRPWRRATYAHVSEIHRIDRWQEAVTSALHDAAKASAMARAGSLIKGYGATRARGYAQVSALCDHSRVLTSEQLLALIDAALADDESKAFSQLLETYSDSIH